MSTRTRIGPNVNEILDEEVSDLSYQEELEMEAR
jgi:hypothetical protein